MYIPAYKIEPGKIIEYSIPDFDFKTIAQIEKEKWLLSTNQYLNDLSEKARKRLMLYLKTLYVLSKDNTLLAREVLNREIDDEIKKKLGKKYAKPVKYRLVFITLTLSAEQTHGDKEIKKYLLNDFLIRMQRRWQTYLYVWKAEKQQNGNIHFHIVVNRYVPYKWIRETWNKVQNKLGYVDRFEQKHGHRDPNSTDVHAVYKIKRLDGYFAKYVTKMLDESISEDVRGIVKQIREIDILQKQGDLSIKLETKRQMLLNELEKYKDKLIEGKIWDASKTLKQIVPYSTEGWLDDEFAEIDFTKMKRKTFDISLEQKVTIWFFDMDDHPELKNFLINFYANQLLRLKPDSLFKVL